MSGATSRPGGLTAEEDFFVSLRATFTAQLLDEGIPSYLVAKYMRIRHLDTFEVI